MDYRSPGLGVTRPAGEHRLQPIGRAFMLPYLQIGGRESEYLGRTIAAWFRFGSIGLVQIRIYSPVERPNPIPISIYIWGGHSD